MFPGAFPDAGPTARALLALEALQSRGELTASELGERLGVSERAARRTVTVLRDIGVPIESTRGRHGGYRLGRGLRLPPLLFSATEALGLVMAVLDGQHAPADPDDPVGAALGKLIAALPENVGRQAALMRDHAAAAPDPMTARPDPDITTALVRAVAEQESVEVDYATRDRAWQEVVDPWAVVVRTGCWYLLCHSHRAGETRTYRVDRVRGVRQTGERFEAPADLDAVADLERHLRFGWRTPTRVVFDAPVAAVRPWLSSWAGELSAHPDDPARSVLVGTTNEPDSYLVEYLLPAPFGFVVEEGDDLRTAARAQARRLAVAAGLPVAYDVDEQGES